jgi:hypothetical protein
MTADEADGCYETVVCRACNGLHFIDRSSGKLVGGESE